MLKHTFGLLLLMVCSFTSTAQDYKELMKSSDIKVAEIIEQAEAYLTANPNKRERKFFERWKYNAIRQQDENGYLRKTQDIEQSLAVFMKQKETLATSKSPTGNWEELGPKSWNATSGYSPGVGRITTFAQDPTDADIFIIGSETGGIWKTTDGGDNWTPLIDDFNNLRVFSLAIDPNDADIYYWGSHESRIYKSTDAGSTWTQISTLTFDGSDVNKILIHPTNSAKMFATDEGNGIFRSDDGGVNWTKITDDFAGHDVEFKPNDPSVVYASGEGFHKSTDGGDTWTTINEFDDSGVKMIGVSPADNDKVYVVESAANSFGGIYVSSDSGTNFTKKPHPNKNYFGYDLDASDMNEGQAPRDMGIAVSPTNANEVHIAGINTYRSLDGGNTFAITAHWTYPSDEEVGYCHADVDDVAFAGNTLVAITDGGIFLNNNSGGAISKSFFTDKTTGMGIHQFYKIGVSQTSQVVITGGSQDNGSSAYVNSAWRNWIGADGMEGFVDKANTQILYGMQQNGSMFRSTDGGLTDEGMDSPTNEDGNWVTPFEQDPIAANTVYSGFKQVFKTTDNGDSWTAISQDFGENLDNLKIAPSDNKIMFASHGESLFKTTTASGTWAQVTGVNGGINSIAIHPTDPNKVAVATTDDDKVYISTDGGANWTARNTGLPNFSALCLTWQDNGKNGLYLGMDYGVFYIEDGMSAWVNFSNQLPNVIVNELEINTVENKLYAATYGRGVWRSDLFSSSALPIDLGEFTATREAETVRLAWFTVTETNNDYFLVQKSLDGIKWEDFAQVKSNGNSRTKTNYETLDQQPNLGLNYYRLVSVDQSGKQQFSRVVAVNLTGVDLVNIYPNPNSGRFFLYLNAAQDSDIEMLLYDVTGKLVHAEQRRTNRGLNELDFNVSVDAGTYFLTMIVDGTRVYQNKRLVVQLR